MANVVIVGYDKMLYSLIKGAKDANHNVLGVFRHERIKYSPLSLFLKDIFNPTYDYSIVKSEKLYDIKAQSVNSKKFIKEIKKLNPDLILVGSWGEKFSREILSLCPIINFHPSLLPQNRGANPYFWTIYLNQKITGLSAHFMDEEFDKGDIIAQAEIEIDENETGLSLKNKTVELARLMVSEVLNQFDKKQIQPIAQDEGRASYQKQIEFSNMILDLSKPKEDVKRHTRALTPWASPYIAIDSEYYKIEKYEFLDKKEEFEPYKIIENNRKYFIISGSDFLLKVYKI